MSIPGFTAEASLYDVGTRYQATTETSFYGGLVLPAWTLFDRKRPIPCLKTVCTLIHRPLQNPRLDCRWEVGYVNQVTGSCS